MDNAGILLSEVEGARGRLGECSSLNYTFKYDPSDTPTNPKPMSLVPFLPNWAAAITVGTVMLLYPRIYVANRYLWNIIRGRDKDDVSALRAWFERLSGVALVAYGVYLLVGVPTSLLSELGL